MPLFAPRSSPPSPAAGTCSASGADMPALLGEDEVVPLTRDSVRGIAHLGGTILRTTNRGNPFRYPRRRPDGTIEEIDRSGELVDRAHELGIDAIISIGGDGSLAIAQRLYERGMKIVGVP